MVIDIDETELTGTSITTSDQSPPDWVTSNHIDYDANLVNWTLFGDSVTGKGGFATGEYLTKHKKEDATRYANRKTDCSYINLCAPIIDTYTGHLYKKGVVRTSTDQNVLDFLESTNRRGGKAMDVYAKEISRASSTFGFCYAIVDMKQAVDSESKETDIAQDVRPYSYTINPTQLINWGFDEDGNYEWINIKETFISNEAIPNAEHEEMTRYRIWTKEEWIVYESDSGSPTARGKHTLGEVPIVACTNIQEANGSVIGRSDVQDIARLNRDIFNWQSESKIILVDVTFPVLTMQLDGLVKDSDTGKYKDLEIGTDRILGIPEGASYRPEYISPTQDSTQAYNTIIKETTETIYKMARLDYQGGAMPSGIALAYRFERTNQLLTDKATNMQNCEERIVRMVKKWHLTDGSEPNMDDTKIQYPDEFNLQDMDRELKKHEAVLGLGLGDTFDQEYKKDVAAQLLPNTNDDIMAAIVEEIDSDETVDFEMEELDNDENGTTDEA